MRRALWIGAVALSCAGLFALGKHWAAPRTLGDPALWLPQVQEVLRAGGALRQAATLAPVLVRMGPEDVEPLAASFEAAFDEGGGAGLSLELFVERLAALDPLLARDRIEHWPARRRDEAFPTLLRVWARTDPRTALEALNAIPDGAIRSDAFPALIEGWVESGHYDGVWRYLSGLPGGMDRERGAQVAIARLVSRDGPDAALREIEALPEEPPLGLFKQRVLRTAVGLLARSDPQRAVEVVDANRDAPDATSLVRRVAVNWVTQDGAAAMAWIRSQPLEPRQRDRVLREVYRRWVVRDRPAALAWLSQQNDYSDLESILDIHASALARSDPLAAIAWVEQLEDPAIRRDALIDVAEVWQHGDPAAASDWIAERGLAREIQRRVDRRRRRMGAARAGERAGPQVEAGRGTQSSARPNGGP